MVTTVLLTVALLLGACPAPAPPEGSPRLIVLVIVDQLSAEMMERYEPFWRHGLRRILDSGARFTRAHHRHASTLTAVGYATLATGLHPRRHGIIENWWYDPELGQEVYAVDDEVHDVSPARLLGSTLGDWVKKHFLPSRVYSVGGKDRSAILLGGFNSDGTYWYDDETGDWITSSYYGPSVPLWVDAFNRQRLLEAPFGQAWEPLPATPEELEQAGVVEIDFGPLLPRFPHTFGGLDVAPGEDYYGALWTSPWVDDHMERFAEEIVASAELGGDEWPDLLALAFSGLDAVGHRYGPESREAFDLLLRLDRALGRLLDRLDREVGLENTLIALSSDHGVAPVPEARAALGLPGQRVGAREVLCLQQVGEKLGERFGEGRWLLPGRFLNRQALEEAEIPIAEVEAEAARLLASCPGVAEVWTRSQLLDPPDDADRSLQLVANSFHPQRSPDLMIEFREYLQTTQRSAATHGSFYPYDTWVPMVLMGPGIEAGEIDEPVATVDLAPTLASLAGVPAPTDLDGRDLTPLLGR